MIRTTIRSAGARWTVQHVERNATGGVLRSITAAYPTYAEAMAAAPELLAEMLAGPGAPVAGAAMDDQRRMVS